MTTQSIKKKFDHTRARFSAFSWSQIKPNIFIIGAGGTGSWTALNLSRIGYPIHIWDFDSFDETNVAGQAVRTSSIGKHKVIEVKELCESLSKEVNIQAFPTYYTEKSMTNNIVISCADSMAVRKMAFEKWVKGLPSFEKEPCVFIDTRMLATQYEVYIVPNDPKKIQAYRDSLFDDNAIPDVDCNSKATTFCGMLCSCRVTNFLTNFLTNYIAKDEDMATIPFKFGEELSQLNIMRYEVK